MRTLNEGFVFTSENRNNIRHAVPVTAELRYDFADLIAEQACTHHSDVQKDPDRLFDTAITQRGIQAFLVMEKETVVGCATYTDGLTSEGRCLYLEDIVTKKTMQGRGIAHFTLSTLAAEAQRQNIGLIQLECAESNTKGQTFYDAIGASRCQARHTWRYYGTLPPIQMHSSYVTRALGPNDVEPAASLLRYCDPGQRDDNALWLREQISENKNPDFRFFGVFRQGSHELVGAAYGYRSYSTFRKVTGLHIGGIGAMYYVNEVTDALLSSFTAEQQATGWTGHVDVTVDARQKYLVEEFQRHKLDLLKYDGDKMVIRRIDAKAIDRLVERHNSYLRSNQV